MNLKSKDRSQRVAYLISPDCAPRNDEELYAAVRASGRAVIRPFEAPPSLKLLSPISLDPAAFEREWQGD